MTKDMKDYTDFTDDDLRLTLRSMDEKDTPSLPSDFADRVMAKLQPPSSSPLKGEGYGRALLLPSGRLGGGRRRILWAAAASVAIVIALSIAFWPKSEDSIYKDTFASAEDACLILSNNTDNTTIAL